MAKFLLLFILVLCEAQPKWPKQLSEREGRVLYGPDYVTDASAVGYIPDPPKGQYYMKCGGCYLWFDGTKGQCQGIFDGPRFFLVDDAASLAVKCPSDVTNACNCYPFCCCSGAYVTECSGDVVAETHLLPIEIPHTGFFCNNVREAELLFIA
jgi:hypothetical protein